MREFKADNLDAAILAFAQSWYGYGGGSPEDIYVQFGLHPTPYFERLRTLLDSPAAATIDADTRAQMHAVCAERLN